MIFALFLALTRMANGSVVYVRAGICELADTESMTVVREYVDAFKGDAEAMVANCADPTSVLDGSAPHV